MARPLGLGAILKAVILAAVLAALLATAWHELASEPVIQRAINLEDARRATPEPELVSRQWQRVGLGVALALYGVTWSLIVGGVFVLGQERLPGGAPGRRAALLVLGVAWAVALFPFFKYPSNPPGVGNPDTLDYRQLLYFGSMALVALGGVLALLLRRDLARRAGSRATWIALAAFALYCALLFVALPGNPDPTPVPADLLFTFRVRSLVGLVLFWGVFALGFGLLVQRASARSRPRPAPAPRPLPAEQR